MTLFACIVIVWCVGFALAWALAAGGRLEE